MLFSILVAFPFSHQSLYFVHFCAGRYILKVWQCKNPKQTSRHWNDIMHGSILPVTIPSPGNPGDKSSPSGPGVGNCLKRSCPGGRGSGQIENINFLLFHFSVDTIGNLSNHDGNAKENFTLKMTSKYFNLLRDSFNSFNLSNVAEQSGSWLCKDGVTVQVEKRKFTVVCSRST